jgi:dethiobiotin synthetase
MSPISRAKTVFITGTDTGVGKTVMTVLLLLCAQEAGRRVVAVKPFCSGGSADTRVLASFQPGLSLEQISPWIFDEPLAPLVAARKHRLKVRPEAVLDHIHAVGRNADVTLVEGAGGILVPILPHYTFADLASALEGKVLVVAPNRLGTLNHTMLTVEALRLRGVENTRVVLIDQAKPDPSAQSNPDVLEKILAEPIERLPWFGLDPLSDTGVKKIRKNFQKTLARLLS